MHVKTYLGQHILLSYQIRHIAIGLPNIDCLSVTLLSVGAHNSEREFVFESLAELTGLVQLSLKGFDYTVSS